MSEENLEVHEEKSRVPCVEGVKKFLCPKGLREPEYYTYIDLINISSLSACQPVCLTDDVSISLNTFFHHSMVELYNVCPWLPLYNNVELLRTHCCLPSHCVSLRLLELVGK